MKTQQIEEGKINVNQLQNLKDFTEIYNLFIPNKIEIDALYNSDSDDFFDDEELSELLKEKTLIIYNKNDSNKYLSIKNLFSLTNIKDLEAGDLFLFYEEENSRYQLGVIESFGRLYFSSNDIIFESDDGDVLSMSEEEFLIFILLNQILHNEKIFKRNSQYNKIFNKVISNYPTELKHVFYRYLSD